MNIIIVDDDSIVRKSLKTILEQEGDIKVLALGQDAREAVELYHRHKPDVLLLDIRMGELSGLDAADSILKQDKQARILFLTTFSDREYILRALRIGAKGYLLKQDYEGIAAAIRAVHSGQTVFGAQVVQALPQMMNTRQAPEKLLEVSEREMEVLRLCAEGLSNKEIADSLYLSEGTVRNYISGLLQKLNLRDRTQLVVRYYKGL